MEKKVIKKLKNQLESEKKRIIKELSSFARRDPAKKGNWLTKFPILHWSHSQKDEDAEEREEYENRLPVEHSLELRLQDINAALEKIKKGEYGKCENCKREIAAMRLEAVPEAKLCMDCSRKVPRD